MIKGGIVYWGACIVYTEGGLMLNFVNLHVKKYYYTVKIFYLIVGATKGDKWFTQ